MSSGARAQCAISGGGDSVCVGRNDTLTVAGTCHGTQSSSNPAIVTIDTSGIVTGISAGTVTIGFLSGTFYTTLVTVKPLADPGTATSARFVCLGSSYICPRLTVDLSTTGDTFGTWSSSNTAVATVNPVTGLMGYVGAGAATISYCWLRLTFVITIPQYTPLLPILLFRQAQSLPLRLYVQALRLH